MQGLKPDGDGQSDQGFRRSAPEDRARRASQRVLPVDQVSAALTRSRRSVSPDSDGPRSPFAINSVRRSMRGTHSQGSGSPGNRSPVQDNLDILSPTGGRRNLQRRSVNQPPPIGDKYHSWGQYDTVQEIMSRPLPPPAITRHVDFKTLGNQGGRWSFHQPVTETYVLSKISSQTPGPGYYADSDPAVGGVFKGRNVPFGKMRGGRLSTSPLREHSYDMMRVGSSVPGPGAYDTDHLFGMYGRIRAAIPKDQRVRTLSRNVSTYFEEGEESEFGSVSSGDSPKTKSGVSISNLGDHPESDMDPFDDGKTTSVFVVEQRKTMSLVCALDKMPRLGTTRYSKLRKEARAPIVRRMVRPGVKTRSYSALAVPYKL